ncbi:MAG TPA: thioesterase family protein [Acidimicrobiia bacterium]
MNDTPAAVFDLDGARAVPTVLARGPWSAEAMHGGAPAALLARALERHDPGPASFVARLTVDLLRPVPLVPLEVVARTTRPGRKVQWLEATLLADGVEVARASALRLRTTDPLGLPLPEPDGPTIAAPDASQVFEVELPHVSGPGFWRAIEFRVARGSWADVGPATMWFRLQAEIVAGEPPSPLQRVAAAADFGNGVSTVLPRGAHLFINPDLSIHLHRYPAGAWVALDAQSRAEDVGVGLAMCELHDELGPIGRSVQALLVDRL